MSRMSKFQPILTDRVLISAFRSELITERYVSWLNDPMVVRFSEQRHRSHSIASCQLHFKEMCESDNLFLSVELLSTPPSHIGNISVVFDPPNISADLSILIGDTSVWGKGYGLEAWVAIAQYLITVGGLRRVTAGTMEVNQLMVSLIKRSGMTIEGVRPRHFFWEGQEIGLLTAALFRS